MNISAKLTAVIFAAIAAFASVSCEKTESSIKPEEILGSFTYEGDTYNIRSVVLYPLDNGQTEIWMSETAGYTTVEQIEASVGELVISMRTADIVNGNELSENSPKQNLWIKYDGTINNGMHVIKCETNESSKTISLNFRSTNTDFSNKIEGSYKGPYSDYSVPELNNQWAYNRQAKDIVSADYFEMEDGKPSRLVIFDQKGKAIELTIPIDNVRSKINIKATELDKYKDITVTYDNGEEFEIYSGQIQIIPADENSKDLKVHINLSNAAGKTLRADYQGAYRHRFGNKTNRCKYDSGSGNLYDGTLVIGSMKLSQSKTDVIFEFKPGEQASDVQFDPNRLPILTISKDLFNSLKEEGEINTQDISEPWTFTYHDFYLASYDKSAPDRPTAIPGSVFGIKENTDGTYSVNIELSYVAKTVTKYRDMVDENGNVVTEWVEEFDELSGEIIKVEKAKQEEYQEDVITTVDLFYNGQATND